MNPSLAAASAFGLRAPATPTLLPHQLHTLSRGRKGVATCAGRAAIVVWWWLASGSPLYCGPTLIGRRPQAPTSAATLAAPFAAAPSQRMKSPSLVEAFDFG